MSDRPGAGSGRKGGGPVSVLLAAASAGWEPDAVALLADPTQAVHLVQRCLDLPDLLGAAATGVAEVAVVSDLLNGVDADSVARLHRHGVRVVVVRDGGSGSRLPAEALRRLDVDLVLSADDLPVLAVRVRDVALQVGAAPVVRTDRDPDAEGADGPSEAARRRVGRLVAVWGTRGAPGRTTSAVTLAADAASRGIPTSLIDVDPYGGAVAQHLAVLDEMSGLLGATRLANTGQLDPTRLAALARRLIPGLRVLTGLPRPGRWPEVRPAAFAEVLTVARGLDDLVVVDTGPGLDPGSDDPFDATPNRDENTRTALAEADAVVALVAPDPVGLQRAARALVDLAEVRPAGADVVAVNRMRSSLGWDRRDVVGLLERVAPDARVCFLPEDVAAADRALVTGRTLLESGDSALRRAFTDLTTEVLEVLDLPATESVRRPARRFRRRTG